MNKLGFISGLLSTILLFLPFIPIGIYFGTSTNPWLGLNYHIQLQVSIVRYGNIHIYLWGILKENSISMWLFFNFLSFIFLTVIGLLAIIFSFIGCFKENKLGKRFMNFIVLANLFIILYTLIGFTIYSREIFGNDFGLLEIYYYLDYGFYILLLNFIISVFAFISHPIKEVEI